MNLRFFPKRLNYSFKKHTFWNMRCSFLDAFDGLTSGFPQTNMNPSVWAFPVKHKEETWFQEEVVHSFALAGEGEIVRWCCLLYSSENTLFCTLVVYMSVQALGPTEDKRLMLIAKRVSPCTKQQKPTWSVQLKHSKRSVSLVMSNVELCLLKGQFAQITNLISRSPLRLSSARANTMHLDGI